MRIKLNELKRHIRKVILENTGSITIGHVASQYPELWETLCESRDYDIQGYEDGSPLMNQSLSEFIEQERFGTDDTYWWKDYYANEWQDAHIALEAINGEIGWERLSYSGLDFDACYQLTAKACERFGVPVPDGLEAKAEHMDDHQAMDAALGSSWMQDWRDKFDLDLIYHFGPKN